MNHPDIYELACDLAAQQLDAEMRVFKSNPSASNWGDLKISMLVYQQLILSAEPSEKLTPLLNNTPISDWNETIVLTLSGQTIETILNGD